MPKTVTLKTEDFDALIEAAEGVGIILERRRAEAAATALDRDLGDFELTADIDIDVPVNTRTRTNIALRCSDGTEVLLSLIDCGDHLSIDAMGYDAKKGKKIQAWTLMEGRGSNKSTGDLAILQIPKDT